MNSINKLSRFAGVLIIFLVGISSAQLDTFKLTGRFSGDLTPTTTTVTSLPGSRGGGTYTMDNGFTFTNLSPLWSGKIHMAAVVGGFSYTAQDTIIRTMVRSTILKITVKDTGRPEIILQKPLSNAVLTVDKMDSIKILIWDNSDQIRSIQYDFSMDSGTTWDTIGSLRKTTMVNHRPVIGTPFGFPFTPKKASDSCIIRVIVQDFFQGNADTNFVSVIVLPLTKIHQGLVSYKTVRSLSSEMYDLSGRKINGVKSMKFYAIKNAGLVRSNINLR